MNIPKGLIAEENVLLDKNEKGLVGVSRRKTKLRIYRFENNYGLYVKHEKREKKYDIKIIRYISNFNTPVKILTQDEIRKLNIKSFKNKDTFQAVVELLKIVELLEYSPYKQEEIKL